MPCLFRGKVCRILQLTNIFANSNQLTFLYFIFINVLTLLYAIAFLIFIPFDFHLYACLSFTYSFVINCRVGGGVELAEGWMFFIDFHKVEGW